MDKEQIKAAKVKFRQIKELNANKIVLRLKKGELVFLVAGVADDKKYIIASYRHEVIDGRPWIRWCVSAHKEWNGAVTDGEKVMVEMQNEAADFLEWLKMKNEGIFRTYLSYYEYDIREEFQWTLNGDDGFFPKGCRFWGYVYDDPTVMGEGIEEEFAEYWFECRRLVDDK